MTEVNGGQPNTESEPFQSQFPPVTPKPPRSPPSTTAYPNQFNKPPYVAPNHKPILPSELLVLVRPNPDPIRYPSLNMVPRIDVLPF